MTYDLAVQERMNTLMRPVAWLSKKLSWQASHTPAFFKSGWLAYTLLAVSIPSMIVIRRVTGREIPLLLIFLALSILVTFRFKPEVFHNLICPFGVLQNLTGRFAWIREAVVPADCIGCRMCETVCPGDAIHVQSNSRKAIIKTQRCHQCQDCVIVCPTHAIRYQKR